MAISPLAEIFQNSMRQTCTIYRYTGTDPTGQPQYAQGVEYPCRIGIDTRRNISDTGDEITNSGVRIVLPAETEVEAYDQVDLPHGYRHGAVIAEVTTATDFQGQPTHKVVVIA